MAWTEQCKIAFRANATGKLSKFKNKNRKVTKVIKELSKESEIPFNTLKKWYYDKSEETISTENGTDSKLEIPICKRCNINKVLLTKAGNPLSQESKFYGLCNSCRRNQQAIELVDREATKSKTGLMTVCPYCEKEHYMNIDTQFNRTKGVENAGDTS